MRTSIDTSDGILFYDAPPRKEKDDYPGLSLETAIDISRELALMLKNKERSLEAELRNMQTELYSLRHSNSWKLTKPLRAIKRIIKHKNFRWLAAPLRKGIHVIRRIREKSKK